MGGKKITYLLLLIAGVALLMNVILTSQKTGEGQPARVGPAGNIILCERHAEVRAVDKDFTEGVCRGSAVIQGISYRCTNMDDINETRKEFISDLNESAASYCDSLCQSLASNCHGKYSPIRECGFTVPKERSTMVGHDIFECPTNCAGQALAYCSIFHGSYLGYRPELIRRPRPNCFCNSIN